MSKKQGSVINSPERLLNGISEAIAVGNPAKRPPAGQEPWRRLHDGSLEIFMMSSEGVPANAQLAANLALIYAARCALYPPPSLGGEDVGAWWREMVAHAESNDGAAASELLDALNELGNTPEAG
jgi:hypothetical protein